MAPKLGDGEGPLPQAIASDCEVRRWIASAPFIQHPGTQRAFPELMNGRVLLGIVLAAGVVVGTWFVTTKPNRVYLLSVSKFVARPIVDELVRVDGSLVHGSVCKRSAPCEYRFRMTDAWSPSASAAPGPELSVRYQGCYAPDVFRDTPGVDSRLSVEGEQCATCHSFEANTILVRLDAVYRMHPVKPLPPFDVPACAKL